MDSANICVKDVDPYVEQRPSDDQSETITSSDLSRSETQPEHTSRGNVDYKHFFTNLQEQYLKMERTEPFLVD